MDNDRDEILNELIRYYDGDEAENDSADADMGATRVMPTAKKSKPLDEEFGNTTVVNVKKKPEPETNTPAEKEEKNEIAMPEIDEDDDKIRVYTPTARKLAPIPEPAEAKPVDEVLGNLDFIGMPIIEPIVPSEETETIEQPVQKPKVETAYTSDPVIEEAMKKRKGIWYSLKPLWVTIICCMVAVAGLKFYVTNDGLIGTYKRNFNYNMGLIFNMLGLEWNPPTYTLPTIGAAAPKAALLSANTPIELSTEPSDYTEEENIHDKTESLYFSVKEAHLLPFDSAGNSVISVFGDGVVCAKSNYMSFIDSRGKAVWELDTAISDPMLSTCGSYIAIAARGGTQLSLYKRNRLIYNIEAPDNIRSCKVSARGDVVLITDKSSYKGAVVMINKKGETVFSWASGVNYITAVNVLKSRRVAVALANAEERVTAYVMIFNINSTEPYSGTEIGSSLVYAIDTNGKQVYINADNSVSCMTQRGSFKYDLRYADGVLTHSATDLFGNRLISYTDDNTPAISLFNKHGSLDSTIITDGEPDLIDVYKTTILYNSGRDVICGKADDEKKTLYTATRTIKSLKLINTTTAAILYADGIEIIRF
ncbi:MAG: hypothetical protein IJH37_01695 [Clostridia bacterium]|nr:hypothetical protein [Clostridia bacterium]